MTKAIGNLFRSIKASVERREKISVGILVLSALVVRLLLIVGFQTYEFVSEWMVDSEVGRLAQSLANGDGFAFDGLPTVWRAPLYPFILSLVFHAFGVFTIPSSVVILIMLAVVSSLTIIPMYYVGKRLFSQEVGFISGVLWAFHPGALRYSVWIIPASSFIALGLVLTILLFLRLRDTQARTLDSFLCGLAIALTLLTRPVVLAFVPFALVWLFWNAEKKRALRQIVLIAITIIITLAPWTIRNYRVFHQFIPITGTFGLNLWQGNNPYVKVEGGWGGFGKPLKTLTKYGQLSEEEATYLESLNEVELSNVLQDRAVDFIKTNPGTFISYTLQRIYLFWTFAFQGRGGGKIPWLGEAASMVSWILNLIVVMLTVLGILFSWKQWRQTFLLLLLLLTFPIPHYITIMEEYRYRFPIESTMFIFVAHSLMSMLYSTIENDRSLTDDVAVRRLRYRSRKTSIKAN